MTAKCTGHAVHRRGVRVGALLCWLWLTTNCSRISFSVSRGKVSDMLSILTWIIAGILVGWIGRNIAEQRRALLNDIVVGVAGALVGGFLFSYILDLHFAEGLNVPLIVAAAITAVLFLVISRAFDNASPT
jgi:uncharacterized membrane protein YeaQ/YmgE (transglycosylase-associated protein family)